MQNNVLDIEAVVEYHDMIEKECKINSKTLNLKSKIDYVMEFESFTSDIKASEFIVDTITDDYLKQLSKKYPKVYKTLTVIVDNSHLHRFDTAGRIYSLLKYITI